MELHVPNHITNTFVPLQKTNSTVHSTLISPKINCETLNIQYSF